MRAKVASRALLALAVGCAGLSGGCADNKSDGQIQSAPEAANTAQAIQKSYTDSMRQKYNVKTQQKP
jgi:hypothetical protein